jgi:hypothetical protein
LEYNTETNIQTAATAGINWLKGQNPYEVKDISRSIQALALWNENSFHLIEILLSKKKNAFWETDKPILDTGRGCSALVGCGIVNSESINWIQEQQNNNNWNNNEIETSYALIALADAGLKNEPGCEWLFRNYSKNWEYPGTTSLILMALIKQNKHIYKDFINNRASWLLSKRRESGWIYIVVSNLVLQALILSGEISKMDIEPSIQWLLGKQDNGNWGNITSTALSLISLRLFLNEIQQA